MNTTDLNKEKFVALVGALSVYFPDYQVEMKAEDVCARFAFKTDPAKGFWLRPDVYRGKFEITPYFKKLPNYSISEIYDKEGKKISPPSAGFSIDRPVEAIAKGIKTRFFPDFELYYSEWLNKWESSHKYKTGKEEVIKTLAEIVGVPAESGHNGEIRENLSLYRSPHASLKEYLSDIRVSSPESIEIKTSYLNLEQAKKLLEFIKTI
jgi:hypothetical protein